MTVRAILGGLLAAFLFACPALAAAPTVTSITETQFTGNPTAHPCDLPATIEAGDLLTLTIGLETGASSISSGPTEASWTELWSGTAGPGNPLGGSWALVADGTEDGGTATITTTGGMNGACQVHRILAAEWLGSLSGVTAGTKTGGSGSTPNPPPVTPSWSGDTLYMAQFGARNDDETVSAYPSGYTDNQTDTISGGASGGTDGATVGTATKEGTAAAENPGTFTLTDSEDWVANTIAVAAADVEEDTGIGKVIIISGDMAQEFVEDTDNWTFDFFTAPPFNDSVMDVAYTTLNGSDAIQVTWYGDSSQAGNPTYADWTDRIGARLEIPDDGDHPNGYFEGWLTVEVMFSSPYGNYRGFKIAPRMKSHESTPSPGAEPTGTFLGGAMLSENLTDTTGDRLAHQYIYDYLDSSQKNRWDAGDPVIGLDELWTIMMYFKYNTSSGAADGIMRTWADAGAGEPTTLRREDTDLQMWATGGSPGIGVRYLTFEMGFNGDDAAWNPYSDSTITVGAWKFEIPGGSSDAHRLKTMTHLNRMRHVH